MISKKQIAGANDLFRTTMIKSPRHKLTLSEGVAWLDPDTLNAVLGLVRSFDKFNKDNDPHEEHDMGRVTYDGEDYYFKIDYYDEEFMYGADPEEGPVNRVMTIMKVSEY